MKKRSFIHPNLTLILFFCLAILALQTTAQTSNEIKTPEEHFGFKPGTDRMLFDYEELIGYMQHLDTASPRLKLVEIGKSPMGKTMFIAFISSEGNIRNLENLKTINRRLALDPNIPEKERESLLDAGRVFFIATLSMHSDEVGPSQSAPLIAHDLVTTSHPQKEEWLNNVVYMMIPCHNPDGMDMVVDHYKKYVVNLLKEHGLKIYRLTEPCELDGMTHNQGDIVIPLAQPFRTFIKEVMERQKYPVRHYTPDGEVIKPYDVTSWSLPLHRGLKAHEIIHTRSETFESSWEEIEGLYALKKEIPDDFQAAVFTVKNNESFKAAFLALKLGLKVSRLDKAANFEFSEAPKGSFVIHQDPDKTSKMERLIDEIKVSPIFVKDPLDLKTAPLKMPRIALVETFFHDMDAGWSRYIFDTYFIPYKVVHPGDFEKTDFAKDFDVILFPDAQKSVLMSGKEKSGEKTSISNYPPEYTKGIGKEGMARLMTFLDGGGIIVSWNQSTELFLDPLEIPLGKDKKEEFQLPVRDISDKLKKEGLYCPGSLLRIKLAKDHPITLGMPDEAGILFEGKPVFATSVPAFDMDRRVVGKFPEDAILLSGYCEKQEKLGNRTCLVWLKKGKGQLVLFGFNPQYRASTNVSFKLLFNAILLPKITK